MLPLPLAPQARRHLVVLPDVVRHPQAPVVHRQPRVRHLGTLHGRRRGHASVAEQVTQQPVALVRWRPHEEALVPVPLRRAPRGHELQHHGAVVDADLPPALARRPQRSRRSRRCRGSSTAAAGCVAVAVAVAVGAGAAVVVRRRVVVRVRRGGAVGRHCERLHGLHGPGPRQRRGPRTRSWRHHHVAHRRRPAVVGVRLRHTALHGSRKLCGPQRELSKHRVPHVRHTWGPQHTAHSTQHTAHYTLHTWVDARKKRFACWTTSRRSARSSCFAPYFAPFSLDTTARIVARWRFPCQVSRSVRRSVHTRHGLAIQTRLCRARNVRRWFRPCRVCIRGVPTCPWPVRHTR